MATEVVAVAAGLRFGLFVECGIIRHLVMLFVQVGCGSLSAEKKSRSRGHWIVYAGLLWKSCVSSSCRTGDVELSDMNSGASCH